MIDSEWLQCDETTDNLFDYGVTVVIKCSPDLFFSAPVSSSVRDSPVSPDRNPNCSTASVHDLRSV